MGAQTVKVLLVDDHTLVRAGIRSLLERVAGVEVVGEAADGREALELMKREPADVVLMDIAMKGLNGLDATLQVKRAFPDTHVIILSMHASEEYVMQALRAGASGYLLKDSAMMELERALAAVRSGKTYLGAPISKQAVEHYMQRVGGERTGLGLLTARQREILQLIAEGNSTKAIANLLAVSAKTVETHRAQLMERLDIHDVPGLVRYAIRTGLVSPER